MPAQVVNVVVGNDDSASPLSLAKNSGAAVGDLLVALITGHSNSLASFTAPSGWTDQGSFTRSAGQEGKAYSRVVDGSEPSTIDFPYPAGADVAGAMFRVSDADITTVTIGLQATGFASASASMASPTITPAGADDLLICAVSHSPSPGATQTATDPSGMTDRGGSQVPGGFQGILVASEQLASGAATGTRTWTSYSPATANDVVAWSLTVKSVVTGPPPANSAPMRTVTFHGGTGRRRIFSTILVAAGFPEAASGPVAAAVTAQRSSGVTAVRKQAAVVAAAANRVAGTASGVKSAQRAAQGQQRLSGQDATRKQWPAATAGALRTSGLDASRKQAIEPAAAAQRSSAAATAVKQAIGTAAGHQRTSGGAERAPVGPVGAAVGTQRTSGQAAGVKTVARVAVGAQRSSGVDAAAKTVARPAAATQRTSGADTTRKQAAAAVLGAQRTAGAVVSFLFVGPNGPAAGHQRSSGAATGRKTGTVTAAGALRTRGVAAGVHRGVGVATGRQRSSATNATSKGGHGVAIGHQRSSGVVVRQPPVIWAVGVAGTQLATVGAADLSSDEGVAVLELAAVGVATTE